MSKLDRSGKTFGKLKLVEIIGSVKTGPTTSVSIYKCLCECGNIEHYSARQISRMKFLACVDCRKIASSTGRPMTKMRYDF